MERVFASVDDYVRDRGGNNIIRRILIANNGISAVKGMRSIREWAYNVFGKERTFFFVVMATPEDLASNAAYIHLADEYLEVPGGANNHNFANVQVILDVARRARVDAVWAGWGHASENPALPTALKAAGITFIGPDAGPMQTLGDKISSSLVAEVSNVGMLPWSGSHVRITSVNDITPEEFAAASVLSVESALERADAVGFPLMVKASEGGGGKGIRRANTRDDLPTAYRQVAAEVPGSPIFLMRLAPACRHLEVQVIGDRHGQVMALSGRDCSVQRRHQKIIEEGPPIAPSAATWAEMQRAAIRLAQAVGYSGAGTVEYLYMPSNDSYCFLELNPRLQVEHPVTEMVTDVNIPATQLQIAMGIPLHKIPHIRRLYREDDVYGTTAIDFSTLPLTRGHCIAARITAENPDEGFKPTSGAVREITFGNTRPDVWGYFSLAGSGAIHQYSDSQFGHIFARGQTREEARRNLVVALKALQIRGDIQTTTEYLVTLLEMEEFRVSRFDNAWLDGLIAERMTAVKPDRIVAVLCAAAYNAHTSTQDKLSTLNAMLQRGQVPTQDLLQLEVRVDLQYEGLKFSLLCVPSGPTRWVITMNGSHVEVGVREMSNRDLLVLLDGRSHVVQAKQEALGLRLVVNWQTCMFPKELDPTSLRAAQPGKLVRFLVEDGMHVAKNTAYVEVEHMKMYSSLATQHAGRIRLVKPAGSTLQPGDLIASFELDDPTQVVRSQPYTAPLPQFRPPLLEGDGAHQKLHNCVTEIESVLAGYPGPSDRLAKRIEQAVADFKAFSTTKEVPVLQLEQVVSALNSRLPRRLQEAAASLLAQYRETLRAGAGVASFTALDSAIVDEIASTRAEDRENLRATLEPLREVCARYSHGLPGYRRQLLLGFLNSYYETERVFEEAVRERRRRDDIVLTLQQEHRGDAARVFASLLSHNALGAKNKLMLAVLDALGPVSELAPFVPSLHRIGTLRSAPFVEVSVRCKHLTMRYSMPSPEVRRRELEGLLFSALGTDSSPAGGASGSGSASGVALHVMHAHRRQNSLDSDPVVPVSGDAVPADDSSESPRVSGDRASGSMSTPELARMTGSEMSAATPPASGTIASIVDLNLPLFDVLMSMFYHRDERVRRAALEIYVQRAYRVYDVQSLSVTSTSEVASSAVWRFTARENAPVSGALAMPRPESHMDMRSLVSPGAGDAPERVGLLLVFCSLNTAQTQLEQCLAEFHRREKDFSDMVLHVFIDWPGMLPSDSDLSAELQRFLRAYVDQLRQCSRATFIIYQEDLPPRYFTFRGESVSEDLLYRHVDPPLAFQLELQRMSLYTISKWSLEHPEMHIYHAQCNVNGDPAQAKAERFFARIDVRPESGERAHIDFRVTETTRVLSEVLHHLELALCRRPNAVCNHIFLNFLGKLDIAVDAVADLITEVASQLNNLLYTTRVTEVELKFRLRSGTLGGTKQYRFIISNPSRFEWVVHMYTEQVDSVTGAALLANIDDASPPGPLVGRSPSEPHPPISSVMLARHAAQSLGTTYVHDFVTLFERGLRHMWSKYAELHRRARALSAGAIGVADVRRPSPPLIAAQELVLDDDSGELVPRTASSRKCGMVVWRVTMRMPDSPEGRPAILIANDITYLSGSFGPREDATFHAASCLARKEGIPRVYIAANSGARIGLAREVMRKFRVEWIDAANPSKGFRFLYLREDEYAALAKSVRAVPDVLASGESVFRITDIIGAEDGLGVENLRGSGLIAGETSRAYDDVFTITFVTGRTVGIGAYLVRLGQRTVQNEGPIILTGGEALNKLLGREVYASNQQLGGPRIMYANGVSHVFVPDDFRGIESVLQWLSYVPVRKNAPLPTLPPWDSVDRAIAVQAETTPYDPRVLLTGSTGPSGERLAGFFDNDSFWETLGGWAKSVVVGRARLGGVPVGVIIPELRTVQMTIPADPAAPLSQEVTVQQAGQVWFPDSAYKTAQAISDMNREQLPLFIFANWRGFSGGMRDMFFEILKYGSYIVDGLVQYRQPVFVYIPPHGELRGGAWVVVDPTINPEFMEMFAAEDARGGVLEPSGTIEIKFRRPELEQAMLRLDPELVALAQALEAERGNAEAAREIERQMNERTARLLPVYTQVAEQFADLHDTPGRMVAKDVISEVVPWTRARTFFFWRLRRRMAELALHRAAEQAGAPSSMSAARAFVARAAGAAGAADSDRAVAEWLDAHADDARAYVRERLHEAMTQRFAAILSSSGGAGDGAAADGALLGSALAKALAGQGESVRSAVLAALSGATQ